MMARTRKGTKPTATEIRTGVPIELDFGHNTKKAGLYGTTFAQHIEPAGSYVVMKTARNHQWCLSHPEWEEGHLRFENPLVMFWGTRDYQEPDNWKQVLFARYKKKGIALSRALVKDGHDGIITIRKGRISEIVDLTVINVRRQRSKDR